VLTIAIYNNDSEMVRLLLENGALVSVYSKEDLTKIVGNINPQIFQLLVDYGLGMVEKLLGLAIKN
jgi:ankyrin repeat protein